MGSLSYGVGRNLESSGWICLHSFERDRISNGSEGIGRGLQFSSLQNSGKLSAEYVDPESQASRHFVIMP